jgi:hypothetical protein
MDFLRRDPLGAFVTFNAGLFFLLTSLAEAWQASRFLTLAGAIALVLAATLLVPGDVLLGANGFIVRTSAKLAETWDKL